MNAKTIRRGGLAGVATLAIAAGVATDTAAASGTKCNPGCEASMEFRSRGEIITVHDLSRDGHSAVGELEVYVNGEWLGHNQATYWNSNGFDGPAERYNESIPDGTPVRYRACKGERGENVFWDCSRYWRHDVA
jgi:hypothetical protein